MNDMTLYELSAERLALQNKLQSLDLDVETIADTLEGESSAITAKIADYGYVIKNLDAFVDAIKAEENRIVARRKASEKKVEHIKEWLLLNMVGCNIKSVECPAFSITVKKNPPKVVIDDESLIPDDYLVVPELPPPSPDKKTIAAVLKKGEQIPGCHLESSNRIDIK